MIWKIRGKCDKMNIEIEKDRVYMMSGVTILKLKEAKPLKMKNINQLH